MNVIVDKKNCLNLWYRSLLGWSVNCHATLIRSGVWLQYETVDLWDMQQHCMHLVCQFSVALFKKSAENYPRELVITADFCKRVNWLAHKMRDHLTLFGDEHLALWAAPVATLHFSLRPLAWHGHIVWLLFLRATTYLWKSSSLVTFTHLAST